MSGLPDFWAGSVARHERQVAEGKHDGECEWRSVEDETGRTVSLYTLCHCSKRRREAAGETGALDDLDFPPPVCPRCHADVEHDGDSWRCYVCRGHWSNNGTDFEYDDEYGDLDPDGWVEQTRARMAAGQEGGE